MRIIVGCRELLVLLIAASAGKEAEYVPVVIWDNVKEQIATPSLTAVSTDGLTRILERKIEASPELSLLVFAEEGLTVEEMTYRARETAGAFGELAAELAAHDELNMTFLLRVERAVVAVSRLDVPTTVVSSDEDGEPARPGEMLIVRFAGRPRNREALKEHVSRMRELYRKWRHSTVPGAPKLVLVTSRRAASPPTADGFYGEEKVQRASPDVLSGPHYWKNNFVYVYLTSDPIVARVGKAIKLEECPTAGAENLTEEEETEETATTLARRINDRKDGEQPEKEELDEEEENESRSGDEHVAVPIARSAHDVTIRSSSIESLVETTSHVPSVEPIVRTDEQRRRNRREAVTTTAYLPSSPPSAAPNGTHTFTMCSEGKEMVRLYIRPEGAFWTIPTIEIYLEGSTYTIRSGIGAPQSFSYHCDGWSATDEKKTVNLSLPGLQIEPYFERSIGKIFGPAYDCVGLTSPAIWTGLLLVWFEGVVFAYGVYMMASLRTNDLYDRPNGPLLAPPSNVN